MVKRRKHNGVRRTRHFRGYVLKRDTNRKRSPWTKEEDARLLALVAEYEPKNTVDWELLSDMIHRYQEKGASVKRRHQDLLTRGEADGGAGAGAGARPRAAARGGHAGNTIACSSPNPMQPGHRRTTNEAGSGAGARGGETSGSDSDDSSRSTSSSQPSTSKNSSSKDDHDDDDDDERTVTALALNGRRTLPLLPGVVPPPPPPPDPPVRRALLAATPKKRATPAKAPSSRQQQPRPPAPLLQRRTPAKRSIGTMTIPVPEPPPVAPAPAGAAAQSLGAGRPKDLAAPSPRPKPVRMLIKAAAAPPPLPVPRLAPGAPPTARPPPATAWGPAMDKAIPALRHLPAHVARAAVQAARALPQAAVRQGTTLLPPPVFSPEKVTSPERRPAAQTPKAKARTTPKRGAGEPKLQVTEKTVQQPARRASTDPAPAAAAVGAKRGRSVERGAGAGGNVEGDRSRLGRTWTRDEEQRLLDLVDQREPASEADWCALSSLIGRFHPRGQTARDRYLRILSSGFGSPHPKA